MAVLVLPYSPQWPRRFEQEAASLEEHLAGWLTGGVQHIGSTAVPGLAAKPILDMLGPVRDLPAARQTVPVLAALGYEHADHRPHEALWFYKQGADGLRTHQLHLTEQGSNLWRERLAFRDALRGDATLRTDYQTLKQELARDVDGLTDYTRGKRDFVAHVLAGAGLTLQ